LGLLSDLGESPVALDSSIFIYFIEEHPTYLPLVDPVFEAIAAGDLEVVTSSLTLLETLVIPFRFGNTVLLDRYEVVLTKSRGVRLIELDRGFLRAAAHLRAATRAKTPDSIQATAALVAGCRVLLTNDGRFPRVPGVQVLQLDDYLPETPP
jgi:predicted nucleic acid-binding protein